MLIPFITHPKFNLTPKFPLNPKKPLSLLLLLLISKMSSSWRCSNCTFIQKPNCQICLTPPLRPPSSPPPPPIHQWSCSSCTFLNPYRYAHCEICGTRASASLLSALEVDDDEAHLGSAVFLPLKACTNTDGGGENAGFEDSVRGFGFGGGKGFSVVPLRSCSNKRKERDGSYADTAVEVNSLATGETCRGSDSKTLKILSYNVWFREDLEMHQRMRALGNLIQLHSPDVICFQEVTPCFYEIFQKSSWWKRYCCSMTEETIPGAYFCMQLSKLPVKSYSSKPFHNSQMGRQLCIAEVEAQPGLPIVVATTHLESPCPSPPTWDQMFSKERVAQAQEAVSFLNKNRNVIFCGDMNWDDKLDGPFPLPDGWKDVWKELKPGEEGWTYDTKSNKMLSGNRALQKRLDRFVCKLRDFSVSGIEMIGKDAIEGLSYVKEKKVKGQVKELVLPVLPSDHYGLLLTICSTD